MNIKPDPRDYIYDLESYPNVFTFAAKHVVSGKRASFEISDRKNQLVRMIDYLRMLHMQDYRMVGFNNLGYDYPLLHYIIDRWERGISCEEIYEKSCEILFAENKFEHMIWDNDRYIEQIDLFRIHHFDNKAKMTSLKMLEFNMRLDNISDLPFPPGTFLNGRQINTLIKYNKDDVDATEQFYFKTLDLIKFREELSEKYDRNFLNHNDTKIGTDYLVMKLEDVNPRACYKRVNGRRQPRQTIRQFIDLKNIIFPYIKFKNPEFNKIKKWLMSQRITETKSVFEDLSCTVNGFKFVFGTGGIHGSVHSVTACADDEYAIVDLDVTSYYPKIAIENRVYPEHLSELFCDIYEEVFEERKKYPKSTHKAFNLTLKLALNGVYGNSNNEYSVFYDPQYTMTITINGQLMLCMLAERLMVIPDLQLLQVNTDGLTVKIKRTDLNKIAKIRKEWESVTSLQLEEARYSRMFIRDVNNYIAEYEDGTLKHKGAYLYDLAWHQNHSSLVIQKAAEAALIRGESVEEFITNHDDMMDFMLRTKVPRSSKLVLEIDKGDIEQQNITRYYMSSKGGYLFKIMPPLWKDFYTYNVKKDVLHEIKQKLDEKDIYYFVKDAIIGVTNKTACKIIEKHEYEYKGKTRALGPERRIGVNTGRKVKPCNDIRKFNRKDLDYSYYISEAKKLVNPLLLAQTLLPWED